MKQIEEYIESNKKLLEEIKKEYESTNEYEEKLRIKVTMTAYEYYIKGLEDAKKYILEEGKENE